MTAIGTKLERLKWEQDVENVGNLSQLNTKGFFKHQALVVQKLDSAIQPLNHYPVNKY